ncbi:hypothetical protein GIB67_017125 [Kingdonia uniflora]|uniref:Uncharacterized protein n=1 Tax=Kingdonia uniflora TaxID=39325 RepID=A0A7J7MU83_9MAGN|nr:hypothetical protein GIB67_017125 [Kingdonia uniflora]
MQGLFNPTKWFQRHVTSWTKYSKPSQSIELWIRGFQYCRYYEFLLNDVPLNSNLNYPQRTHTNRVHLASRIYANGVIPSNASQFHYLNALQTDGRFAYSGDRTFDQASLNNVDRTHVVNYGENPMPTNHSQVHTTARQYFHNSPGSRNISSASRIHSQASIFYNIQPRYNMAARASAPPVADSARNMFGRRQSVAVAGGNGVGTSQSGRFVTTSGPQFYGEILIKNSRVIFFLNLFAGRPFLANGPTLPEGIPDASRNTGLIFENAASNSPGVNPDSAVGIQHAQSADIWHANMFFSDNIIHTEAGIFGNDQSSSRLAAQAPTVTTRPMAHPVGDFAGNMFGQIQSEHSFPASTPSGVEAGKECSASGFCVRNFNSTKSTLPEGAPHATLNSGPALEGIASNSLAVNPGPAEGIQRAQSASVHHETSATDDRSDAQSYTCSRVVTLLACHHIFHDDCFQLAKARSRPQTLTAQLAVVVRPSRLLIRWTAELVLLRGFWIKVLDDLRKALISQREL